MRKVIINISIITGYVFLVVMYAINMAAIDELELKLQLAAKTEVADKRYIRSLNNQLKLYEQDMVIYHTKRGTTVNEVLCDDIANFLMGKPSFLYSYYGK